MRCRNRKYFEGCLATFLRHFPWHNFSESREQNFAERLKTARVAYAEQSNLTWININHTSFTRLFTCTYATPALLQPPVTISDATLAWSQPRTDYNILPKVFNFQTFHFPRCVRHASEIMRFSSVFHFQLSGVMYLPFIVTSNFCTCSRFLSFRVTLKREKYTFLFRNTSR